MVPPPPSPPEHSRPTAPPPWLGATPDARLDTRIKRMRWETVRRVLEERRRDDASKHTGGNRLDKPAKARTVVARGVVPPSWVGWGTATQPSAAVEASNHAS